MPACLADHDMGAYLACVREEDVVTRSTLMGAVDYMIQAPSALFTSLVALFYTWR